MHHLVASAAPLWIPVDKSVRSTSATSKSSEDDDDEANCCASEGSYLFPFEDVTLAVLLETSTRHDVALVAAVARAIALPAAVAEWGIRFTSQHRSAATSCGPAIARRYLREGRTFLTFALPARLSVSKEGSLMCISDPILEAALNIAPKKRSFAEKDVSNFLAGACFASNLDLIVHTHHALATAPLPDVKPDGSGVGLPLVTGVVAGVDPRIIKYLLQINDTWRSFMSKLLAPAAVQLHLYELASLRVLKYVKEEIVRFRDDEVLEAFGTACRYRYCVPEAVERLRYILDKRSSPAEEAPTHPFHPAFNAVEVDNVQVLRFLLTDPRCPPLLQEPFVLKRCIQKRAIRCFRMLLSVESIWSFSMICQEMILYLACSLGDLDSVQCILELYARFPVHLARESEESGLNLKDELLSPVLAHYNPLCAAVAGQHVEICSLLLQHGADPNVRVSGYGVEYPLIAERALKQGGKMAALFKRYL